jgi:hypothetical protein
MPTQARHQVIERFLRRPIHGRLREVAGIVATNHARHCHTDYEILLREFPRATARQVVRDDLHRIVKQWRKGAPIGHPEHVNLRRHHNKLRAKLKRGGGDQSALDDFALREAADLAEFCRRWLWGHFEA